MFVDEVKQIESCGCSRFCTSVLSKRVSFLANSIDGFDFSTHKAKGENFLTSNARTSYRENLVRCLEWKA